MTLVLCHWLLLLYCYCYYCYFYYYYYYYTAKLGHANSKR